MSIYSGSDIQNLIAQINKDNPQLPWALNEADFIYGKPQVVPSPVNRKNTTITVTAKGSSKYRGSLVVTYERLDLANLFRSLTVQFTRWLNDGVSMTQAQSIAIINQMYGTNFQLNGFTAPTWAYSQSGGVRNLVALPTNWMYIGTVPVTWYRGLQELGLDILTVSELDGAQWPGGNDFVADPDRKYRGELLLSGIDLTEFAVNNGWTATSLFATYPYEANSVLVLNEINRLTGLDLNATAARPYDKDTNPLGMGQTAYRWAAISLPNPAYPMANKPGFAYAKILQLQTHPTFKAPFIVYFNL